MTSSWKIILILMPFSWACSAAKQQALPGILEEVVVRRDSWGINHIEAKNERDLFFSQGYLAAKDRLFQFELWRRKATGTTAELVGPAGLKSDIGARLLRYRKDMDVELNHYHPRGKLIIESYVDGVNAYIEETRKDPALLPFEFTKLGIKPGLWTPEVVVSRHNGIRSNAEQELSIGRALAHVDAQKIKKLLWFHPGDPDLTLDPAIDPNWLAADLLDLYLAVGEDIPFEGLFEPEDMPEGSNNWIISGARTQSGFPILANDPHRRIALPSLRYIVHLKAPGWNVIGGGEPVIPGVSIGHNDHGAWGLTIFQSDAEDLYVYELNPANPNQYKYQSKWEDMTLIEERIAIKGQPDSLVTLRYTRHGPVTYLDTENHRAAAVRAAWLEPGAAPYLASLRMNQATNWAEFQEACNYSFIPGENMIWADKTGTIGWQAVGITPKRPNFSGMVPVPGDGRYEWDGYWPNSLKPSLTNPEKGFWATANQHVTPADYPYPEALAFTWADPFRGDRVNEVLAQDSSATLAKSMALQVDVTALPARQLKPLLLQAPITDPKGIEALEWMKNWDYQLLPESVAAGMYVAWERALVKEVRKRFVPETVQGLIQPPLTQIIRWMNQPDLVYKENALSQRDLLLAQTWATALDDLAKQLGPKLTDWAYGQAAYKHIALQHPLSKWVDAQTQQQIDLGPLPRGGYAHTPAANGSGNNQTAGASFRMVTDLADWDLTQMTNTPGQSGDPRSPFYQNLFEDWAKDRYFPAYFSNKKIKKHSVEQVMFKPSPKK
jgi:penicillin amidase